MKLVHPEYIFQIEFQENLIQRLVIESSEIMSDLIVDLKEQIKGKGGRWVLSHAGELLNIADICEIIIDFFDLEINQRKMLNALYQGLESEINNTELLLQWRNINSILAGVLDKAIDSLGYNVSYAEADIKSFLKVLEVRFQETDANYLEYLLEYLQLAADVRGIKIFILVNITSFLSSQEIQYLYEEAFYRKYHLLLVDSRDVDVNREMERKIIIDL